jgi:hypothetical protein
LVKWRYRRQVILLYIKTSFSYELKKALEVNPYKIVDSAFETISNGYDGVTLIEDYSWNKWSQSFCNLIALDVSCVKLDPFL